MKKSYLKVTSIKSQLIKNNVFKVNGLYGSSLLQQSSVLVASKKKLVKDKLKQNFTVLQSVNTLTYATLTAKGIGYKLFTPKAKKFLNTVVVKMGFGGSALAWKAPDNLRVRAKKQKLTLIGLDKAQVKGVANNFRGLKYPGAYTGKGIQYKGENILLKKRKAATRSK